MHQGETLKNLIKRSSYTQKEVAEHIGIDHKYFNLLLKTAALKSDILEKASQLLGVNMEEHFSASDDEADCQQKYEYLQERFTALQTKYIETLESLTALQQENLRLMEENMEMKGRVN